MAKIALLIGVSDYDEEPEFNRLPGTQKDIEAMEGVLRDYAIGGFDEVKVLSNPDPVQMQMAIQTLFSERQREDLVLLYFSGHGITDRDGNFYMTSCKTRKNLFESTTVSASFVHGIMSKSNAKRQVIILDCCYSGAFARDWQPKAKSFHEWALLTSSTFARISLGDDESGIYSRYLIEGLKTGAADTNSDGVISIDELHDYAKKKVQEAAPAMNPELHPIKEGYKINLAQAPLGNAKLEYRKAVEEIVEEDKGEISSLNRIILDELRNSLDLLIEEATVIENEVLKPFREKQQKLQRYEQLFYEVVQQEYPVSEKNNLKLTQLQEILKLKDEDVKTIINKIIEPIEYKSFTIVVVGEFKRGKSTFINALLGEEVLPADIEPCSATLARVTYGLNPFTEIEFKNGRKEKIAIDALANYITKLTPEAEATAASIKEVVINYPTNFCKNNINIIDTPGISEEQILIEVAFSTIPKADLIILVIMAQSPFSLVEQDFLENKLQINDLGKIIFVITGIDRLKCRSDAERSILSIKKRIKEVILSKAEQQWGKGSTGYEYYLKKIGEPKVFGLSPYQALEAKVKRDPALLGQSRFLEFEANLQQWIMAKQKLTPLQIAINRIITSSQKIIKTINVQEKTLEIKQKEINEMRLEAQRIITNARNLSEQLILFQSIVDNASQK